MNKSCEYCQYNGPYGSIINPCEHCPNNDFMINGTKVGGTSLIEFKGTQFYGINISFEDASELVSQVIPPRSIKPVGFANYSYRDSFKEDILNALYGVR